ncbi:alpha/beta hydrolase [Clostridium sp.]|uniref:alpha/beta hydrolase n=1 Tax=Clostridium sp. TaxID=1506 RepID=UPI003464273A
MYTSEYDENIKFLSYDRTKLEGSFARPKVPIKAAVLMLHGIPSWQHEWGLYARIAKSFCEYGIASLRFNYRFCYDGEKRYGNLNKLTISQLINDSESAYWTLRGLIADGVPIYIIAISFSGGLSIKWINSFNRSIKGLFLMAPCFDYEYEVLGNHKNYNYDNIELLNEDQIDILNKNGCINQGLDYGKEMVREAHIFNIYNELNILKTKVKVFQGTNDKIVPISITKKILSKYPSIELIEIKDAKHSFGGSKKPDGSSDHEAKSKNIEFITNSIINNILVTI